MPTIAREENAVPLFYGSVASTKKRNKNGKNFVIGAKQSRGKDRRTFLLHREQAGNVTPFLARREQAGNVTRFSRVVMLAKGTLYLYFAAPSRAQI